MRKKVWYISVATVMTLSFAIFEPVGFTAGSPWWTHITFQFCHAGLLHLFGNMLVLWWCMTDRWYSYTEQFIVMTVGATLASLVSAYELPTIGFSGDIFLMIGMTAPMIMTKRNALIIALSLATGFIMPHCNGMIHLSSFIVGLLYTLIRKGYIYDFIAGIADKKRQPPVG